MLFASFPGKQSILRQAITAAYRLDETECVTALVEQATFSKSSLDAIHNYATQLVIGTREQRKMQGGLDSFLHQYDLSSEEGIALMCMAEALLRIPDKQTIDLLIQDKISTAEWENHLGASQSLFVNAATWSLLLTGKIYAPAHTNSHALTTSFKKLVSRLGASVIRPIILKGMKIIGKQFVMGSTIAEALKRAKKMEAFGYRYSYDMLGEAARTAADADNYFHAYEKAIIAIGKASQGKGPIHGPGISIKLSALHPRYELAKHERIMNELVPRLLTLAKLAKTHNIGITVDAEEADRLDMSLDILEAIFVHPDLADWEGFGLAVQAYQKRAPFIIDWLADLSTQQRKRWMIRLVKGAYWDAEIKQSQVLGLDSYPVFTRKNATDVSYLACAKKILALQHCFFAQFGTHNAYSVAAIREAAQLNNNTDFEFQCLHGMGQPLYDQIITQDKLPCRIYAPVGHHKELLGYLVRRLLENGANTSFINRIADDDAPIESIIANPVARIASLAHKPHPYIPLPNAIYGASRRNAKGLDVSSLAELASLKTALEKAANQLFQAGPVINGQKLMQGKINDIMSPSDNTVKVGQVAEAAVEDIEQALIVSYSTRQTWAQTPIAIRAACLRRAADLFEEAMPTLIWLLGREAGKTIVDSIGEVREAVDFCRYYAERAEIDLADITLPGPTGELNKLSLHGRGVFVCISPWNFPLAIFVGQIVAALVAGNTVIAKPAEQTPLIAAETVRLLLQAGIPPHALQLLPGRGEVVGAALVADSRVAGIMFTGSTETAKFIQQSLASRQGPIIPFIAETGGQNAMIIDSSALPEQVVTDVLYSAFNSAGQRCSALRVLFVQEDIAPQVIAMLKGALAELTVGDPSFLSTDVGPVIDNEALKSLQEHYFKMKLAATFIDQASLPPATKGHFFAPCIFEIPHISVLEREIFGPILHIIRYPAHTLDTVLSDIEKTGYGLTFGIHSRIDTTIHHIIDRVVAGNIYVNRNIIGAVVGVQPFGGEGLSGTGPKAGGPHYLPHLCAERSISINITAAGGNASLVSLREDD